MNVFLQFIYVCSDETLVNLFLIFSEKTLVDRAVELQAELEIAASDVSNLFAKIGLYLSFFFSPNYCHHTLKTKLSLLMDDDSREKGQD